MDMSRVLRVDFAYTATFFDVVKAIQLAGKRVVLTDLNELNAALLEALGVNRYAILVRRKSSRKSRFKKTQFSVSWLEGPTPQQAI